MKPFVLALRPQQWVKNLFVFLPLIFGHKFFSFSTALRVTEGFGLFCLVASAVYLFNDLWDLEEDRLHPIKKRRPLAAGHISPRQACGLMGGLGGLSLALAFRLDPAFGWTALAYGAGNILYSTFLKQFVIVDVFCLGGFFLLRIIAGTVLSGVEYSHWMIFLIVLLAMFLGFNKRRQELRLRAEESASSRPVLAKYNAYFIDQMIAVLTSSIVVVYAIYTVDRRTTELVGSAHLIYSIPFVYYGIFRYLYLVHKRHQGEDPTRIILSDWPMQVNVLLWILVCMAVIYYKV